MSSPDHYAAIVLGSGQGATPLSTSLAKAGHRTLLIEASHIGGSTSPSPSPSPQHPQLTPIPACINEGCTPTKTMVASARIAHLACRASDYGVRFKKSSLVLDLETVRKRKRDIVTSFRSGSERRLQIPNLEVVYGKGRFTGPCEISITPLGDGATRTVTADRVFVSVGCRPAPLAAKNADKTKTLDSTSVMELGEVPRHLVVVGGGYVGVEFAQMFKRFGAKVSLIQRGPRLLPREDEDVSEAVHAILTKCGIEIYLGASIREIGNIPTGQTVASLTLQDGADKTLICSHVLAATGRIPNTGDLGLESAGVEVDKHGFIKVDPQLRTSADGVWALGDVHGGPQFTHISYDDFRIIEHNLLKSPQGTHEGALEPKTTTDRLVPYTVFMDPQLGRIGHSTTSARAAFPDRKLAVAKMPMEYVARALEMAETKGFMKAVVDVESKQILGFACLGIEGGEVMSMVQIAMMGGLSWEGLRDGVFAHPCLAESLNNLWGFLEEI
jgi:pyruvate/2-oxoglutarate dehydrogenase complex dihydrolipoamide dehydrogenase (E3) component